MTITRAILTAGTALCAAATLWVTPAAAASGIPSAPAGEWQKFGLYSSEMECIILGADHVVLRSSDDTVQCRREGSKWRLWVYRA
ncbi:hypothetical protein [Actinomadura kijaniata]|uniref:hypothetical protein n=1 Tax=Actinomadura kijaniata TaxID=46161 RepID=UPI00082BC1BE|nr:hypothetical protein [Actinomadura kijaniata]